MNADVGPNPFVCLLACHCPPSLSLPPRLPPSLPAPPSLPLPFPPLPPPLPPPSPPFHASPALCCGQDRYHGFRYEASIGEDCTTYEKVSFASFVDVLLSILCTSFLVVKYYLVAIVNFKVKTKLGFLCFFHIFSGVFCCISRLRPTKMLSPLTIVS